MSFWLYLNNQKFKLYFFGLESLSYFSIISKKIKKTKGSNEFHDICLTSILLFRSYPYFGWYKQLLLFLRHKTVKMLSNRVPGAREFWYFQNQQTVTLARKVIY